MKHTSLFFFSVLFFFDLFFLSLSLSLESKPTFLKRNDKEPFLLRLRLRLRLLDLMKTHRKKRDDDLLFSSRFVGVLSCSDDRIGWYTHFQTAEKEEEEEEEEEEKTALWRRRKAKRKRRGQKDLYFYLVV